MNSQAKNWANRRVEADLDVTHVFIFLYHYCNALLASGNCSEIGSKLFKLFNLTAILLQEQGKKHFFPGFQVMREVPSQDPF